MKTGSVFPAFCHATFHHSLIRRAVMYSQRGTIAQVCLDQDTFDFMQGHVTKHQQMAVPVKICYLYGFIESYCHHS